MSRHVRRTGLGTLLLIALTGLSACGDDERSAPRDPGASVPSSAPSVPTSTEQPPATTPAVPIGTATPTSPATPTTPAQSARVMFTGRTEFFKDGQPIDAAGLAAVGWTIDTALGTATWTDVNGGVEKLSWDVPPVEATNLLDVDYWGEVTAPNLAIGPISWKSTNIVTESSLETGAHSLNGVRADAPQRVAVFSVPLASVGTAASISLDTGFPVPVLITYHYVYI